LTIERINNSHNIEEFDCEEVSLNEYLQKHALKHTKQGFGKTYVLRDEEMRVLGYHTIASVSVKSDIIPVSTPRLEIPAILLARLAVDKHHKEKGLGKLLLFDALKKALEVSEISGGFAVTVDALHQEVKERLYLKFGFEELLDNPLHLFYPMKKIKRLFSAEPAP
jgi:GNAT superfamily N-acetyltransferase